MTHNNDTTDTEDNGNNLQSDGAVTEPKEKFLFREPIVLSSIICLSLFDGLSWHLAPKRSSDFPREVFTVYHLSLAAVPMAGLVFATFLSEFIGRKHVYRYLFVLSVLSFILVLSSRHPIVMSVIFILNGMIRGGSLGMNPVAISEYSSPKHRFTWMIFDRVAGYNTIGRAMSAVTLDPIVFYVLLVIQIVLGLICLGSTWAWPESPYWLANNGKHEQSRTAFMWLRGMAGREELASVLKARRRPGPAKLFWISLLVALATISVTIFSKAHSIELSIYYLRSTSKIHESQFYIHLFGTAAISCALATASYFVRRKLIFIVVSFVSFILCYAEDFYLYLHVYERNVDGVLYYMLHTTSEVLQTCGPFVFGVILFIEITPHKYNTIISCFCFIVMILSFSLVLPLVRFSLDGPFEITVYLALSTTFALVAALLFYFFAPETKDKTLHEIQRFYTTNINDSNTEQNHSIMLDVVEALDEIVD